MPIIPATVPVGQTRFILSRVTGYVSLGTWMLATSPQIYETYIKKQGTGVSILAFSIWIFGDLLNLVGGVMQGIVVTAIFNAVWYLMADSIVLSQFIYYYNYGARSNRVQRCFTSDNDQELLIEGPRDPDGGSSITSQSYGSTPTKVNSLGSKYDDNDQDRIEENDEVEVSVLNPQMISAVVILLTIFVVPLTIRDVQKMAPDVPAIDKSPDNGLRFWPQLFGYLSGLFYVTARSPIIVKNYINKSTNGFALGYFVLAIIGNITYAASIFLYSCEYDYLVMNIPWLIGSIGALLEDLIIAYQFYSYRTR